MTNLQGNLGGKNTMDVSKSKMTLLDILQEEHLEKSLHTINELTDSNFDRNSALEDIFDVIAEKWDSL